MSNRQKTPIERAHLDVPRRVRGLRLYRLHLDRKYAVKMRRRARNKVARASRQANR